MFGELGSYCGFQQGQPQQRNLAKKEIELKGQRKENTTLKKNMLSIITGFQSRLSLFIWCFPRLTKTNFSILELAHAFRASNSNSCSKYWSLKLRPKPNQVPSGHSSPGRTNKLD